MLKTSSRPFREMDKEQLVFYRICYLLVWIAQQEIKKEKTPEGEGRLNIELLDNGTGRNTAHKLKSHLLEEWQLLAALLLCLLTLLLTCITHNQTLLATASTNLVMDAPQPLPSGRLSSQALTHLDEKSRYAPAVYFPFTYEHAINLASTLSILAHHSVP